MDSGTGTGTPGLAWAALMAGNIVGEGLGEPVAGCACCGICCAVALIVAGLLAGCAGLGEPDGFDDESETTLPLLQANKLMENARSAVTSAL